MLNGRNFTRVVFVLVASLSLLGTAAIYGQETTGSISGTVSDSNGGIVPKAKVVVTDSVTGAERTTTTTEAGIFFFTNLPVGTYQLTAERTGFKKSKTAGIQLHVNDKLDFPIVLQLGQVNEVVTVESQNLPLLQTETAEVSNLIGNTQMTNLPLNGRYFNSLVDLVPGAAPDAGRLTSAGDTAVSVNGNSSNSNLYLVDGQYDEVIGSNNNLLIIPPVDAIEEFKILRNNYSAEFGEANGAIINVVSKGGSKDFHGSLFEFLRNDAFNANDFFSNRNGTNKSELRQHEFGGTVGGPIWIPGKYNVDRNKDFFFVALQFRREVRGDLLTGTVPTLGQRQGILQTPCVLHQPGCDPQESPVGSNESNVPVSAIDPNAVAILNRYPLPNASFAQNGFNFIDSAPQDTNNNYQSFRWDHNFSDKAVATISYMQSDTIGASINNFWGDDSFPSVNTDRVQTFKLGSAKLTYIINPQTVNDFQVGYSNKSQTAKTSKTSDPTLASRDGFTYTELFPETSGSFPTLNGVDGFSSIAHTLPFINRSSNIQVKDDVSHFVGKHNFNAGFFARISRNTEPANGGGDFTAGTMSFGSFEDMLRGVLSGYTEEQTQNVVSGRGHDIAAYIQDAYKVRPNLTLNLGLRWQYLGQVFATGNNISSFYPARYNPSEACPIISGLVVPNVNGCNVLNGLVTPKSSGVPRSLEQPHYNDWEPRVGFSWDPGSTRRFLIRGGAGIYHARDAFSLVSAAGQQPPFDLIPQINGPLKFSSLAPFNTNTPQPPVRLNVLDPIYPNPVSYQYSLGIQYELLSDTSLEVNYVGSRQVHLSRNRDINQIPAEFQSEVYDSIFQGGSLVPDTVRPFLGYSIINVNERAGASRYNSLQVFLNHRLRAGLQFQIAYTFSRSISDASNQDSEARNQPVLDAYNAELDKALAPQDITHSLVLNYVWEIPIFRNSKGFVNGILGGWHLNGITTFRSGMPQTVCLDNDYAGLADGGLCERPDLITNPMLSKGDRTLNEYFDTAAFVSPAAGTFGTAGRSVIRGPGINNWDMSLFKDFSLPWFGSRAGWVASESAKLRFEAGFFNAWNHAQFSSIGTEFVPQKDGAGNPIPGSTAFNSSFGKVTGDYGPREIQLGLRLVF